MQHYQFNVKIQVTPESIIGIDTNEQYGFWEYSNGAEAEGVRLWFAENGETGALELIAYDGASQLPTEVKMALHHAGYISQSDLDSF